MKKKWKYPLDLWWSLKKSPFLVKWLARIFYPFVKMVDKETMIFIFKKTTLPKEASYE